MPIHSQLVLPPHASLPIPNDAEANISHFNKMLRKASTLVSFQLEVLPRLGEMSYPIDEEGVLVPLTFEGLTSYARTHVFLEHMSCFCPLRTGIFVSPKVIRPKAYPAKVFIGCFQWAGPGTGCGYFMDLQQSLSGKLHLQRTKMYKRKALDQILDTKNTYAVLHHDSAVPPLHPAWDASVNEEAFDRMLAQSAEQPEVVDMPRFSAPRTPARPSMQAGMPVAGEANDRMFMAFVSPGYVSETCCLIEPVTDLSLTPIHSMPTPTWDETVNVLQSLISDPKGVPFEKFMRVRVIASCTHCDNTLGLCAFEAHSCVVEAKEWADIVREANRLFPASLLPSTEDLPPSSPLSLPPSSPPTASSSPPITPSKVMRSSPSPEVTATSSLGKRFRKALEKNEKRARVKLEIEDPATIIFDVDA
ncbi:hypothetical protein BC835DRAFT_1417846 [Cytidiella melzeri]|nr:hypothetical protein BC835DRAFT_1417846 [Cytidiella melzeri]